MIERMISSDGSLNLYRDNSLTPFLVRKNYARHYRNIKTVSQFFASLRAGPYAWPGGYETYFICEDGGVLCHDCANQEKKQISYSIFHGIRDGWKVESMDSTVSADEETIYCNHCNKTLYEPENEEE